jgi:hypothetical protein
MRLGPLQLSSLSVRFECYSALGSNLCPLGETIEDC